MDYHRQDNRQSAPAPWKRTAGSTMLLVLSTGFGLASGDVYGGLRLASLAPIPYATPAGVGFARGVGCSHDTTQIFRLAKRREFFFFCIDPLGSGRLSN